MGLGLRNGEHGREGNAAALVAIDNRRDPFPPNTKMRDYIAGWLDEHATQVRPRTIPATVSYSTNTSCHISVDIASTASTPAQIRQVWKAMSDAGQSPATVRQARAALGKAMNDAVADSILDRNPVAPRARHAYLSPISPSSAPSTSKRSWRRSAAIGGRSRSGSPR